MSRTCNRRRRRSEQEKRRDAIEDRLRGALRSGDFERAIESNHYELGLPEYLLEARLRRHGWKTAPTPEERRLLIAQRYGVPVKWVKLEEELAKERTTKIGFITKLRASVVSSLGSLVSCVRRSPVAGR